MTPPLLQTSALRVAAEATPLLEGLDLDLRPGQVLPLVGPSGCGKSTLLRVISGLAPTAGGTLSLGGRTPLDIGWPAWRRRVGLLPQHPAFLDMDVEAGLRRAFRYRTAGAPYPAAEARRLLDRLGLPPVCLARRPLSLSVGERQRIALVRALLVRPEVLLLDEPTSALDEEAAARVEAVLEEAAAESLALLWVSHDRAQVQRLGRAPLDLARHRAGGGS